MARRSARINHLLDEAQEEAAKAIAAEIEAGNGVATLTRGRKKTSIDAAAAEKTTKAKGNKLPEIVTVHKPLINNVDIAIIGRGGSPFMVNAFSVTSRAGMLKTFVTPKGAKGEGKTKEPKNPRAEYEDKFYAIGVERPTEIWFPARATKAMLNEAFRMTKDGGAWRQFAKLVHVRSNWLRLYGTPVPDCQPVRLPGNKVDLRFRPRIDEWAMIIEIEYLSSNINSQSIVNIAQLGGYGVGLGDGRPCSKMNCNGNNGRFTVVGMNGQFESKKTQNIFESIVAAPQSLLAPEGWDGLAELQAMADALASQDPEDPTSDMPEGEREEETGGSKKRHKGVRQ